MRVGGRIRVATGRAVARLARTEGGLTVVEVIVAGMIMVVGGLGVLGMVDASSRNTFRAEQSQVVANVLQREMEAVKERPYEEVALATLPVQEGGENDPNSRIADSSFDVNRSQAAQDLKPLVSGGTVAPGPTSFAVEDVSGTIYRYVVWDECPEAWQCEEGELMKRVIVAVKLASTAPGGADRRYQELQGQIVDPETEPAENPGPPPGSGDTVQWKLYLTDTPCDQPERKEHPEANGSHPTHNTRGDCADGPQEGNMPGAPDLLWPATTLLGNKEFKYDYATDVDPQPDEDQGLQLLPGGECGSTAMTGLAIGAAVEPDPAPGEKAFQRVHRWLSPPIPGEPSDESVVLTGSETSLYLWTRTVGEVPYQGRVCAWLFVRSYEGTSITDTLALNVGPPLSTHFDHFTTAWPHSGWEEVILSLNFEPEGGGQVELPPGSRLGLALSVGGDTPTGLQFVYDEPSFDTRLEVTTTGAVPPGVESEPPEEP